MVSETLAPGSLFAGRFRIERELGRGGMGVVYAAFDEMAERDVAVKVIARRHANDPEFVERFKRECKAVGALTHENIVRMYDVNVTSDGAWYLVMERLEGMSLRALLQATEGGRLGLVHAAHIAIQLADAVRVAHAKQIWHRDIKPENIFLGKRSHLRLLDFGLSKRASAATHTDEERQMGTCRYMPPEQILGKVRPDHRADLYQIGCVLFEMCTGCSPFDVLDDPQSTVTDIQAAHAYAEPTALRELLPSAPARAEEILDRLLAKNREHRYQTAEDLGFDLYALILELVPRHHPIAVKSMRDRSGQSGEWPVMGLPAADVAAAVGKSGKGGAARYAETAPIGPAFVAIDPSPAWTAQPAGRGQASGASGASAAGASGGSGASVAGGVSGVSAGGYGTPGVSRTARGTVRMLASGAGAAGAEVSRTLPAPVGAAEAMRVSRWNVTEPIGPAVAVASPTAVANSGDVGVAGVVHGAPGHELAVVAVPVVAVAVQTVAAPVVQAVVVPAADVIAAPAAAPGLALAAPGIAPVPSFDLLEQLAGAEDSAAEEAPDGEEDESPRERARRVLFLRYLGSLSPLFTSINRDAVERAIAAYLDRVAMREVVAQAKSGARVSVAPPTPPPFSSPPAAQVPRAQKTRQWVAAVAGGFGLAVIVALTSASLRGRWPSSAAVVTGAPSRAVSTVAPSAEVSGAVVDAPVVVTAAPTPTATVTATASVTSAPQASAPRGTAPQTVKPPQKAKPVGQPVASAAPIASAGEVSPPPRKQSVLPRNPPRSNTTPAPVLPAPKVAF